MTIKLCDPAHYRDSSGGTCCPAWKTATPTGADPASDWFVTALPDGSVEQAPATHALTGPNTWHLPSECPDQL